jgi:ferredoxin
MEFLLDAKKLFTWVKTMIKKTTVIGIQAKGDKFDFDLLSRADSLRLDYDVALSSPKRFFLPPVDPLLSFSDGKIESAGKPEPFVLFGVHPYDFIALRQLDKLFALKNPDVHYLSRREAATIVVVDVEKPSKNVFSGYLGFSHVEDGYDILLTNIGLEYVVDVKTDKGKAITAGFSGLTKASAAGLEKRKKKWLENASRLRQHALKPSTAEIGKALEKASDHRIWKEKARLCFSCGTCNLVCPTCYCFDVLDLPDWNLSSGNRVRTWDGCMLESFAVVAGGHNFRKLKEDRYRHRYYRKGKYVPDKIGEFSCVGCGRCIGACVTHIANPVEVYNAITEE